MRAGASIVSSGTPKMNIGLQIKKMQVPQQQIWTHGIGNKIGVRADSCENTINNIHSSMINVLDNNRQSQIGKSNLTPMQMAILNKGQQHYSQRYSLAPPVNSSYDLQARISATQDSRTGILTKTGMGAIFQSLVYQKSRVTDSAQSSQVNSYNQTKRSGSQNNADLIKGDQNVLLDEDDGNSISGDSSGSQTNPENKQQKALDLLLSQNASKLDTQPQRQHSILTDLIQKEKDASQIPKIKAQKVPSIIGSSNELNLEEGTKPVKPGQPFDFKFIKIVVKKGNQEKDYKEVFLERKWVQKNNCIPHFSNVIKNVDQNEGVEITMNCNLQAFLWIIDLVKIQTNADDKIENLLQVKRQLFSNINVKQEKERIENELEQQIYNKMDELDINNCLNILVTSYFLQLEWVYEKVWHYFFIKNFSIIINQCQISLSNINPVIVKHIAERISLEEMELLNEDRKDKFISNVYKAKIDLEILSKDPQPIPGQNTNIQQTQIYWCNACQKLMTKEYALKIPCLIQQEQDKENIFLQMLRKNKGILLNAFINQYLKTNDDTNLESKNDKQEIENQANFIDEYGKKFYTHEFIFEQDIPELIKFVKDESIKINLSNDQVQQILKQIKISEPINSNDFVKFFREKYRLCWKEIYLKFRAILYRPEVCKECKQYFGIQEIVGCKGYIDDQDLMMHKVDFKQKESSVTNEFNEQIYNLLKREVQVIDNISICKLTYFIYLQMFLEKQLLEQNEKIKTPLEILIEKFQKEYNFIEPQSMNFEIKLNEAFQDFLKQKEPVKKQSENVRSSLPEIIINNQIENKIIKINFEDDELEDSILYIPKAKQKINKQLKDKRFLFKIQKECEQYVLDNIEEFEQPKNSDPSKPKMDYEGNQVMDDKSANKKRQQLDTAQQKQVQLLVQQRIKQVRGDIIYFDDRESMIEITKILLKFRDQNLDFEEQFQKKQRLIFGKQDPQKRVQSNLLNSPQNNQLKNINFNIQRHKSPQIKNDTGCEYSAAQAGVKIYSDIKQITVKKNQQKKQLQINNTVTPGTIQRKSQFKKGIAMSQGNRSGSNQGSNTNIPPVITQNNFKQRENSSNPVIQNQGIAKIVGIDESSAQNGFLKIMPIQRQNIAMDSPNHKGRILKLTVSAQRVQNSLNQPVSLSMEYASSKIQTENQHRNISARQDNQ